MGACTVASVRDAMDELLKLPIEGACACVEHDASDDVAPALAAYARRVAEAVNIPVIASGGAGTKEHFYDVLTEGKADAALAASLFHYGELGMGELKEYLAARGVAVRRV